MTADTQIIPIPPPSRSSAFTLSPEAAALSVEVAKCLKLVAPASMQADAQLAWIASAVDALNGIRASEVSAVSAELRRTVTRPAQIVPEISRLVAGHRKRLSSAMTPETITASAELRISEEAHDRLANARTISEVEAARAWERSERMAAGLSVHPLAPPLSRAELDNLPSHVVALGLSRGFLERRAGALHEVS